MNTAKGGWPRTPPVWRGGGVTVPGTDGCEAPGTAKPTSSNLVLLSNSCAAPYAALISLFI
eukprot:11177918-Lingulodinium_polyedra.AAC.1